MGMVPRWHMMGVVMIVTIAIVIAIADAVARTGGSVLGRVMNTPWSCAMSRHRVVEYRSCMIVSWSWMMRTVVVARPWVSVRSRPFGAIAGLLFCNGTSGLGVGSYRAPAIDAESLFANVTAWVFLGTHVFLLSSEMFSVGMG